MSNDVHHIMRRVGTNEMAEKGLAETGPIIDALISNYLSEGWEIQSTHLLRVVPLPRKRWWEFCKTNDDEQENILFDFLWVLVR